MCRSRHSIGVMIKLRGGLAFQSLGVSTEIDYPRLTNCRGETQSRDYTESIVYRNSARFEGWRFRAERQMVDGTWTFTIRHRNRILLRKSFAISFGCNTPIS